MKKEKKKGDKNKDQKKFNFLGEWNALNPDPPVVKPDKENLNFLGDWNKLNPDPPVVKDDTSGKKGK